MSAHTSVPPPEPITLLLPGGGPLGVAFQAGALIGLEDLFGQGFRTHVRSIIGSSAGAVTGSFLSIGLTPQLLVKSLSGRFPDEIEYFDPSILLQFDRGRVPNPFLALWRSVLFFLADLTRGREREAPLAARKERYEGYLRRVDDVINLIPKGWFSLAGLEAFLRRNLSGRRGRLFRFDHLPIDLFICATDLTDGRAVLFGKKKFAGRVANTSFFSKHQYVTGQSLAHAILCSSAIPFLFVPHCDERTILADGDTRNATAVGVAKSLVGARFMVTINPLVPMPHVTRNGATSQLFLQTLLTALEGNVVANLKLQFEEKYHREQHGEETFDIIYFRPSPEDMQAMTGGSVVNLFRYQPMNVFLGYRAVYETMRDHPEEATTILGRYGYTFDLSVATQRYKLLENRRQNPEALEDTLLLSKQDLASQPGKGHDADEIGRTASA
jgi:predicted acylesterase/phospholipase RssA